MRYLVGFCVRWFIGTLPDRPIGLYRLKHEVALQKGLAYLSRYNSGWFCHRRLVFESQTRVGNLKMLSVRTLFLSVIMLGAKIYA
jgi:hypothetical protein